MWFIYLLTEWEGRTGKYLARGHGVRTERSEVQAPWPRAKYFPVRRDLTQSISILLYDHHAFPFSFFFFFFFRVTKFGMLLILTEKWGFIQQQSCFSSLLAHAIDKIPVWGPYAILAGPDGFFQTCSRHHTGIFSIVLQWKRVRGRTGHIINFLICTPHLPCSAYWYK